MIVRILGEGQLEVPEAALDELNEHDEALAAALESVDRDAFATALAALLKGVRARGEALPEDHIGPSDLVLPGPDSSFEEVRGMLTEEGLIPG
ncbi:MAG: PspA-associated protein PspAA [Actinomycetota bacterium]